MENTIKINLLPTFFHCPDTRISQNALSNVFIPLQQYISCTVTQRPQPSIRARARLQQCQQARQASAANYQAPPLMMDVPGLYGQQKHWVMPAIADTSRRATRATISHLSSGFCRGAVSSSLRCCPQRCKAESYCCTRQLQDQHSRFLSWIRSHWKQTTFTPTTPTRQN